MSFSQWRFLVFSYIYGTIHTKIAFRGNYAVSTKVGKKSQIVIPREIRNAIGLTEGDELIIDVIYNRIIMTQKPRIYSKN